MNDDLSNKIISRIDTQHLKQIPRWRFILLRVVFLMFALLSIIVGGLALGTMFFLFLDFRNHGLPAIPHDLFEFLLFIPYIWLIVFVSFILIGRESVKHIKKGYRYKLYMIIIVIVFLSVVFGSFFNLTGVGEVTHQFLNDRVPIYNFATYDSMEAWNKPSIGKLAGIVVSIKDQNNFSVIDLKKHVWHIILATSTNTSFVPEASSTVRMRGVVKPHNYFLANYIVEWEE